MSDTRETRDTAVTLDLEPAARRVSGLLDGVSDEQLDAPTPCADTSVGALLDHFVLLTAAFRDAARKVPGRDGPPPEASAEHLDPQWRSTLPRQLDELVAAWREPAAWEGIARVGGLTLPADATATIALDELVLHGWDLARATGQAYEPDPASARACFEFASAMSAPEQLASREGLFGPVVEVAPDAPLFHRALGFAGRDPGWSPS